MGYVRGTSHVLVKARGTMERRLSLCPRCHILSSDVGEIIVAVIDQYDLAGLCGTLKLTHTHNPHRVDPYT